MFTLNHVYLQLGKRVLLEDASLNIFSKQKIGVIGANGSGKSTLFSMLLGKLPPDKGDVGIPSGLRIAHLSQETPALDMPAIEYIKQGDKEFCRLEQQLTEAEQGDDHDKIAALHVRFYDIDGYTASARAARLLDGLGFTNEEFNKPVKSFSGGWRMRLNLGQALMCPSDILLLDEPTNHLDLDAILWLENYLQNYPGTLLLISHDREFLDNIVDHIVHIERQQCKMYTGNYSGFEKLRAEQLAIQQASYEKQQKQISHMMEFVDRFRYKASKAKQAQSRLKAINRLELVSAAQVDSPFHFEFKPASACSDPLLRLEKVDVGYDDRLIFKNLNLSILSGSRIGLLGPNGAGKSTFIKLLVGTLQPKRGIYQAAKNLKIGYYAQHQLESLRVHESPLQHMKHIAPMATEQQLRTFLGGFDFRGDVVFAPIANFSGGEKARLALAILIWQAPNLLLLDEPTNHLDLEMRSALTLALQSYQGAMIIISHDRYLLSTSVDQFMLVANQQVIEFEGTVDDYKMELEKHRIKIIRDGQTKKLENDQEEKTRPMKGKWEKKSKQLEIELVRVQSELANIEQELSGSEIYQADKKTVLSEKIARQKILKQQLADTEKHWLDLQEKLSSASE